jgi:hypothetical protein
MREQVRVVGFVLAGVAGLLVRDRYAGPLQDAVRSYGGNVAASFAMYFLATRLRRPEGWARVMAAGAALATVESFEAFDGFGVMSNTFDRWDFVANAAGVALAYGVDVLTAGWSKRLPRRDGEAT